jgi:hypothetical protein
MKIILSPTASNKTTTVSLNDLTLTIDGQEIDLSIIPVGGEAEPDDNSPFIGKATRDEVTIRYEYNSQLAEPNQSTSWDDYTFELTEGEVPCPIIWKPIQETVEVENV